MFSQNSRLGTFFSLNQEINYMNLMMLRSIIESLGQYDGGRMCFGHVAAVIIRDTWEIGEDLDLLTSNKSQV